MMYKIISKDNKSTNGGEFDWTDYLPKGKRKGKWTPKEDVLDMCTIGYHLTEHWCFWLNSEDDRIFEAEGKNLGDTQYDKTVYGSVRLLRELHFSFDGKSNSGNRNSGDNNSGDSNSGDRNPGDRNSGDWNSGDWNSGDLNSGFLNTDEPTVRLFNKDTGLKREDIDFPLYFYFDLGDDYKESWIKSFKKADIEDVKKTLKLPNFDYELFEEITGITKLMFEDSKWTPQVGNGTND